MRLIKKLDIFIFKSYALLFAGTFFICLFVFMLQFMWRYLEDLIGKGLTIDVLLQFFYYACLMLIPMSLPLAILLASLITFGNFGERFELLSMKAAGIPLVRILRPIFLFTILLAGWSFYFQNVNSPQATRDLYTLIYSMRQKSPEVEIPEGIFYNELPGYNLFVERKDKETGMLYGTMFYTNSNGYEDAEIVLADSARLQSTADKRHLRLTLYSGERFRNMETQGGVMQRTNVPYMRETFIEEVDLIPFDNNFNMMDASLFAGNAATKDIRAIERGLDSLLSRSDSLGHAVYRMTDRTLTNRGLGNGRKDSATIVAKVATAAPFDTLFLQQSTQMQQRAMRSALNKSQTAISEYEFREMVTNDLNRAIRLHRLEWHKKFTLSLACIIFFFIGAPLGAIIRKGGLGVPVVVSVSIFIFYYIVNVSGEKMAKTGEWPIWFGVWLSSFVLAPIGIFLTYKANRDSVAFNIEAYVSFFRRLLGLRDARHIARKEVIIQDPDYPEVLKQLAKLKQDCRDYSKKAHLKRMPNYLRLFFRYEEDRAVTGISQHLETLTEELSNSRDSGIIDGLNHLPILSPDAHTRPSDDRRLNLAAGLLVPLGVFFFFRVWRYRLRLYHDMQQIQKYCTYIEKRIKKITDNYS
ncbi:MAG: LptF/LptG family permease [Paraprevotella sp.]|nr:LptF/LptG family permease [Paraprevotella sp.]